MRNATRHLPYMTAQPTPPASPNSQGATAGQSAAAAYRALPSVDTLLREPSVAALVAVHGSAAVLDAARSVVADARRAIAEGGHAPEAASWPAQIDAHLEARARPSLQAVINATGVIIHTNLGRAPLSAAALAAIGDVGSGYSSLEYNLEQRRAGQPP